MCPHLSYCQSNTRTVTKCIPTSSANVNDYSTSPLFVAIFQGLLARGDMRGGNVEKDDQMVPLIKEEHKQALMVGRSAKSSSYRGGMHSRSMDHLDEISGIQFHCASYNQHMADYATKSDNSHMPLKSTSLSPSSMQPSKQFPNDSTESSAALGQEGLMTNRSNGVAYPPQVAQSHSRNYIPHSTSHYSGMVPPSRRMRSGSNSGNPVQHSNTSIPLGGPNCSSMPSLYISNDPTSMETQPSTSHMHRHPSSFASHSGSNLGVSVESESHEFLDKKINRVGRSASFSRPSSLPLVESSNASAIISPRAHQSFYCPNCKQTFSCSGHDSFDSWFDHVKGCSS